MLNQLRSSVTYANSMATVAVFVALGGTSYAVATGSIDSREIKNNTVRSKDIRNNDVRSKDIRNNSLLTEDFKAGQLLAGPSGARGSTGPRGESGKQGEKGEQGPQGTPGSPGANGVSGYQAVRGEIVSSTLGANSSTYRTIDCPAGKVAVGGGFNILSTSATEVEAFQVLSSERSSVSARWEVWIRNTDAVPHNLSTVGSVICVTALP